MNPNNQKMCKRVLFKYPMSNEKWYNDDNKNIKEVCFSLAGKETSKYGNKLVGLFSKSVKPWTEEIAMGTANGLGITIFILTTN